MNTCFFVFPRITSGKAGANNAVLGHLIKTERDRVMETRGLTEDVADESIPISILLTTPVMESAATPDRRYKMCVDSGFQRIGNGFAGTNRQEVIIGLFNGMQRAGRVGRKGPGFVIQMRRTEESRYADPTFPQVSLETTMSLVAGDERKYLNNDLHTFGARMAAEFMRAMDLGTFEKGGAPSLPKINNESRPDIKVCGVVSFPSLLSAHDLKPALTRDEFIKMGEDFEEASTMRETIRQVSEGLKETFRLDAFMTTLRK